MIMTIRNRASNRLREFRANAGLTQAELAERAGISRTAVTAIEGQRLIPSVSAALALAQALDTTVERLFGEGDQASQENAWAWTQISPTVPFWEADVSGRRWMYPAESAPMLTPLPDGPRSDKRAAGGASVAAQTLAVAGCDPAAGLLASEYVQQTGLRMLVFPRSSGQALQLLREGKVHVAGLHLSTKEDAERNAVLVRETLGTDYELLRIATWQEGIAMTANSGVRTVRAALRSQLKWVGREPGSGARRCLDHLLGNRPAPRRVARNHRGVVEAVQCGWADAGICVQLASAEAGLDFLPVQEEAYELCVPRSLRDDPRVQALMRVVRSVRYREMLGGLPGYDTAETGELRRVN